jgi:hypothetical protein
MGQFHHCAEDKDEVKSLRKTLCSHNGEGYVHRRKEADKIRTCTEPGSAWTELLR